MWGFCRYLWCISEDALERTVIIKSNVTSENEVDVTNSTSIVTDLDEYQYTETDFCGKCGENFYHCRSSVKSIGCEQCGLWYHISCAGISRQLYEHYSNIPDGWFCKSRPARNQKLILQLIFTGGSLKMKMQ